MTDIPGLHWSPIDEPDRLPEPITLYLQDANGTVCIAEQVGWLSNPERRGGPYGSRKLYEDDEPMFRLVAQSDRPVGTED